MKKMRYLFAALLLFVAVRPVKAENRSLSVQVKTTRTTVRNNEEISVSTSIRNTGETETRILVWACAFPSEWTVDNPSIDIDQPNCLAEDRTWINLKRGEEYRRVVEVYVRAVDVYQKEVTFRMGFGNRLFSEDQKHNSKAQAVWSNPVTLIVTR